MFTTNGGYCDLYFLFAKTPKGPSAFLVDAKSAKSSKHIDKLATEARLPLSCIRECSRSEGESVGTEGEGFDMRRRCCLEEE